MKLMYNVLASKYNYLDENIYLHFWDNKKGYKERIYVDGPADWEVSDNYLPTYGLGINQTLNVLATKMTKNDLFILSGVSRGGRGKGKGSLGIYDVDLKVGENLWYAKPSESANLKRKVDTLTYTKAVLVFEACCSGTAIYGTDAHPEWNMKDEGRIIVTATKRNQQGWCEVGSNNAHGAFLYEGRIDYLLWPSQYYPGFLKNMGSVEKEPHSVKYAFNKGYDAATHNRVIVFGYPVHICESHPRIFNSEKAVDTYW